MKNGTIFPLDRDGPSRSMTSGEKTNTTEIPSETDALIVIAVAGAGFVAVVGVVAYAGARIAHRAFDTVRNK